MTQNLPRISKGVETSKKVKHSQLFFFHNLESKLKTMKREHEHLVCKPCRYA